MIGMRQESAREELMPTKECTDWCTLTPNHDGPCAWSYVLSEPATETA